MKALLSNLFEGFAAISTTFSILGIIGLSYVLFILFPQEPNKIYVFTYLSIVNIIFWAAMILLFISSVAIMNGSFRSGKNPLIGFIKLIIPLIFTAILAIGLSINDYKGLTEKYGSTHSLFNFKK